jgi:hypothetical protein
VDTALKSTGINERVPYDAPLIKFSHKRDVCLLARMMSANLYVSEIEDLLF